MPEALVIIPTFNERENIGELLDRIFAVPLDLHALVVDDASPDGTAGAVRGRQGRYGEDRLHLLVSAQGKAGRGSACLLGFAFARERGYGAAIEMDADLSHDPADIPRLLSGLSDADVVIGSKYVEGGRVEGWEWYRHVLSRLANLYAGLVLRIPIRDYTNGYRCYGAKAVALLPALAVDGTGFTVIPQTSYQLSRAGMRLKEIPIVFTNRRRGASNMSVREIAGGFFAILRIRSRALHLHAVQSLKFGLTGAFNSVLSLGLLTAFVEFGSIPVPIAVALADFIAVTSAFLINKHWTFRPSTRACPELVEGLRVTSPLLPLVQYVQFWLVYGSSISIAVAVTWFLTDVLHVWYLLARITAIPLCALWNYGWLHCRVFRANLGGGQA